MGIYICIYIYIPCFSVLRSMLFIHRPKWNNIGPQRALELFCSVFLAFHSHSAHEGAEQSMMQFDPENATRELPAHHQAWC